MRGGSSGGRRSRLLRLVGPGLAIAALGLVSLEAAFRLAALFVPGPPAVGPEGQTVVLCVGDSHTRGRPDPDNYPVELERLLNQGGDRPYRVINLGVPGISTAEIAARFERYLDHYRPAIVLHWAGINNGWNGNESARGTPGIGAWLAQHSRVARLVQVLLFYRRLRSETLELRDWQGERARWRLAFGGFLEEIETDFSGAQLPQDEVEMLTRNDLSRMMDVARQRAIPMFLVTYPLFGGYYDVVNRAIVGVSANFDVPHVDSFVAVEELEQRMPQQERFDASLHPTPPLYRQIAREAYRLLVRRGLVPARDESVG
jgi:lysophospholipase L1-like esterase